MVLGSAAGHSACVPSSCEASHASRAFVEIVADGGASRCTAPPNEIAPTPYSEVVALQYWLAPTWDANASICDARGSFPNVTTTTFGDASTDPARFATVGAAG